MMLPIPPYIDNGVELVFGVLEPIVEDEIAHVMYEYQHDPSIVAKLYGSFRMVYPQVLLGVLAINHPNMKQASPPLIAFHVNELLHRVAHNEDLTVPTKAEFIMFVITIAIPNVAIVYYPAIFNTLERWMYELIQFSKQRYPQSQIAQIEEMILEKLKDSYDSTQYHTGLHADQLTPLTAHTMLEGANKELESLLSDIQKLIHRDPVDEDKWWQLQDERKWKQERNYPCYLLPIVGTGYMDTHGSIHPYKTFSI